MEDNEEERHEVQDVDLCLRKKIITLYEQDYQTKKKSEA